MIWWWEKARFSVPQESATVPFYRELRSSAGRRKRIPSFYELAVEPYVIFGQSTTWITKPFLFALARRVIMIYSVEDLTPVKMVPVKKRPSEHCSALTM